MGRLIDEDAVKRRMHETMDYQDLYLPVHFEMCMNDVPTVEPASPLHSKEDQPNDYDPCYECGGYGDDYRIDEDGELVSNCPDCPFNKKEGET